MQTKEKLLEEIERLAFEVEVVKDDLQRKVRELNRLEEGNNE